MFHQLSPLNRKFHVVLHSTKYINIFQSLITIQDFSLSQCHSHLKSSNGRHIYIINGRKLKSKKMEQLRAKWRSYQVWQKSVSWLRIYKGERDIRMWTRSSTISLAMDETFQVIWAFLSFLLLVAVELHLAERGKSSWKIVWFIFTKLR